MSKIEHDSVNNILRIVPDDKLAQQNTQQPTEQAKAEEKKKLRGFILTYVETQEAMENYQKTGQEDQHRLMPVLSENEQSAVDFVRSKGLFPMRIYTYEYILLQKRLIEQVAQDNNLELIVSDVFDNQHATRQD